MTWAAVWCCCTPPIRAAEQGRACCMEKTADPAKLPADAPHCPVVQLREASQAATPIALPSFEPTSLCLLSSLVADVLTPTPTRATGHVLETADPPPPAPTLLALHTSLIW